MDGVHFVQREHSTQQNQDQTTLDTHHQARAGYEFLALCALVLSFLLGRQVSPNEALYLLRTISQDRFFPFVTFILGMGFYRYVNKLIAPLPSELKCISLEDAYGRP